MSVYFISCREIDYVKIGYAFNPVARLSHLRTSCPLELTLEGAIPGGFAKERELHQRFASARIRREWFRLTLELQAEIDASTRPEKFTYGAVRLWLKTLADADKELAREATSDAERAALVEQIQTEMSASARRSRLTVLERLEAAGEIHFPFRSLTLPMPEPVERAA